MKKILLYFSVLCMTQSSFHPNATETHAVEVIPYFYDTQGKFGVPGHGYFIVNTGGRPLKLASSIEDNPHAFYDILKHHLSNTHLDKLFPSDKITTFEISSFRRSLTLMSKIHLRHRHEISEGKCIAFYEKINNDSSTYKIQFIELPEYYLCNLPSRLQSNNRDHGDDIANINIIPFSIFFKRIHDRIDCILTFFYPITTPNNFHRTTLKHLFYTACEEYRIKYGTQDQKNISALKTFKKSLEIKEQKLFENLLGKFDNLGGKEIKKRKILKTIRNNLFHAFDFD